MTRRSNGPSYRGDARAAPTRGKRNGALLAGPYSMVGTWALWSRPPADVAARFGVPHRWHRDAARILIDRPDGLAAAVRAFVGSWPEGTEVELRDASGRPVARRWVSGTGLAMRPPAALAALRATTAAERRRDLRADAQATLAEYGRPAAAAKRKRNATRHKPGTTVVRFVDPDRYSSQPWLEPKYHKRPRGRVLADNDPAAWQGSMAFGRPDDQPPTQAEVDAHIAEVNRRLGRDVFTGEAPVLWDDGTRSYEPERGIVPYDPEHERDLPPWLDRQGELYGSATHIAWADERPARDEYHRAHREGDREAQLRTGMQLDALDRSRRSRTEAHARRLHEERQGASAKRNAWPYPRPRPEELFRGMLVSYDPSRGVEAFGVKLRDGGTEVRGHFPPGALTGFVPVSAYWRGKRSDLDRVGPLEIDHAADVLFGYREQLLSPALCAAPGARPARDLQPHEMGPRMQLLGVAGGVARSSHDLRLNRTFPEGVSSLRVMRGYDTGGRDLAVPRAKRNARRRVA